MMISWTEIQSVLNNRELALFLWIILLSIFALFHSGIRKSFSPVFQILKKNRFLLIYFLIGAYLIGIIFLLKIIGIWQTALLKEVFFWFFSIGIILVFKINAADNFKYFKGIFFSAFQWTIILEFVMNLHAFSLTAEIIILPFLVVLGFLQETIGKNEKSKSFSNCLQKLFAIIGLTIFLISLYKTIQNFESVLNFKILIQLLLPIAITILYLPFLYFLALYNNYEGFFRRLNVLVVKTMEVKKVKKLTLLVAHFNLEKVKRISQRFDKGVLFDNTDLKNYIKFISRKT